MDSYSVREVQERWDEFMDRVEGGETICVENDGKKVYIVPVDEEIAKLYKDHNEAC